MSLSTHVLNTSTGRAAAGVKVEQILQVTLFVRFL